MTKRLTNLLGAGLVAGAGLLSGGCAELGAVFMTSDNPIVKLTGTALYVGGEHENRMEEAREGRSQINVNTSNSKNGDNPVAPYYSFFTANRYQDVNENDRVDYGEVVGKDKKIFNLDQENMEIIFLSKNTGEIHFKTYKKEICIGRTTIIYSRPNVPKCFVTGPEYPKEGDFVDAIKGAGPGYYRLEVSDSDNKLLSYLDLIVEGDTQGAKNIDRKIKNVEELIKDFYRQN